MFLIHGSGSDDGKVVITIMSDGYTLNEQNKFIEEATTIANNITNRYPYSLFKDRMNIHAIKVISDVSGLNSNTYFQSSLSTYISPSAAGHQKAAEFSNYYTPSALANIIISNTTQIAPCAFYENKMACITSGGLGFVGHELGHALGQIVDEYTGANSRMEAQNCSHDGNPQTVRWKNFIGIEDISTVKVNEGFYYPSKYCLMGSNRNFCLVCSAALTERMADAAGIPFYGTLFNGVSLSYTQKPLNTNSVIHMPDGTDRIVDFAFHGCDHLESLFIPESVKTIGNYAFFKCTALTEITNYAATPQNITGNDRFYGVARSNITLYVPAGTKEAYVSAGWTGFKDIIEKESNTAQKPSITKQPSSITAELGGNTELTVNASVSKGILSYQWYEAEDKNGLGGKMIAGAVNSKFNPPVNKEGIKYYYCVITNTDSSAIGSQTSEIISDIVSVTVFEKGQLLNISRARVNTWSTYGSDAYQADCLFDHQENTYWHGNWGTGGGSGSSAKQEGLADLDLGCVKKIQTIEIDKRYLANGRGPIKSIQVLVHNETGDTFPNGESMRSYTDANVDTKEISADFAEKGWNEISDLEIDGLKTTNSPRQTVTLRFEQPVETRYIRLAITCAEIDDNGTTNDYVQISEIRVFGSEIDIEELIITDINISGKQTAGCPLTFTTQTTGGNKPIQYAFYIIGEGRLYYRKTCSMSDSFEYTPVEAGTYSVRVYAIDSTGKNVVFNKDFIIGSLEK